MFLNFFNYLSLYKRKIKYKKISYSFNAVDLIIDYMFKKNTGIYLDIGSQHPISNNNTYLLFKRGWSGVNIDLDKKILTYLMFLDQMTLILIMLFPLLSLKKNYTFIMKSLPLIHLTLKCLIFKKHQLKKLKLLKLLL